MDCLVEGVISIFGVYSIFCRAWVASIGYRLMNGYGIDNLRVYCFKRIQFMKQVKSATPFD